MHKITMRRKTNWSLNKSYELHFKDYLKSTLYLDYFRSSAMFWKSFETFNCFCLQSSSQNFLDGIGGWNIVFPLISWKHFLNQRSARVSQSLDLDNFCWVSESLGLEKFKISESGLLFNNRFVHSIKGPSVNHETIV